MFFQNIVCPKKRNALGQFNKDSDLNQLNESQITTDKPKQFSDVINNILKHSDDLEFLCSTEDYIKMKQKEENQNEQEIPQQNIDNKSEKQLLQSLSSGFNIGGLQQKKFLNIGNILDSMFPPNVILKKDGVYLQKVLGRDIERQELNLIETQIQIKLAENKSKKSGICFEREEIHFQLFDEVIRQATINCPERGMLLFKVRDQIKMTLGSYKILHQGSIVFGQQKCKEALQDFKQMEDKLLEQQQHKKYLINKKNNLQIEYENLEESYKQINEHKISQNEKQIKYLEGINKNLLEILGNINGDDQTE